VVDEYNRLFYNKTGWTGGDGAYSIPMSNHRVLWLFGDSWIGSIKENRHVNATLVNNAIAIQDGKEPDTANIRFLWKKSKNGEPRAFITPVDGIGWYWMYHGLITRSGLYIFMMQIDRTDEKSVFGFKLIGTWLCHVADPNAPPETWQVTQHKIPWAQFSSKGDLFFGSSTLREKGFIYIYGTKDEISDGIRDKHMILARVPENRLLEFEDWTFYSGNGHWGSDFTRVKKLFQHAANEYSVSYLPALNRYITVYTEKSMTPRIVARLAERPEGFWGDPIFLYQCPEVEWHKDVFCYAAKGHPELSSKANEIVVTYMTNSMDFNHLENDARFYWPRFLRIRFQQ
jgi:hypothetical protein